MRNVHVTEVKCKSALNRVANMPFEWSLNPYRGCQHACSFCYARKTHPFLGLSAGEDFSRQLFAKINIAAILESELARRQVGGVAVGTATDPYQPIEKRHALTGRCLEVLAQYATAVSVTTRSPLVVRDADRLRRLDERYGAHVNVSLGTLDSTVARWLEPGAPAPKSRIAAIRRLAQAGVRVGVFVAPILPGITDDRDQLSVLLSAVAAAGATYAMGAMLRLDAPVKPWFYGQVARVRPDLLARYRATYGEGTHARGNYGDELSRWFEEERTRLGLASGPPIPKRNVLEQMRLPV